MLCLNYPSQILHLHEGRVKDALYKAEQARRIREAKSGKGTDELGLRRLILKLWDWGLPPVTADQIHLTWNRRPGH